MTGGSTPHDTISPEDLARIGAALYRGVVHKGRPAWQSWLADGMAVDVATVRRWLMASAKSRRAVPPPVAAILLAAEQVAEQLCLWRQPRGTLVAHRMAEIISSQLAGP